MSPLPAVCDRRQFQLYLLAGFCLAGGRYAAGSKPAANASRGYLVEANNAFALSLLREVETDDERANQFFSPFSIESALGIALEGARGQTALEMGTVLGYPSEARRSDNPRPSADVVDAGGEPWDMPSIRADFQSLNSHFQPASSSQTKAVHEELSRLRKQLQMVNEAAQALQRKNRFQEAATQSSEGSKLADRINTLAGQVDQFELYNANSLWLDASYPLSKKYQGIIDEFYGSSGAFRCDFQMKADAERMRINHWVGEQTHDKIKDIIPSGALTMLTRLVIANAIYFKGTWSQPFDAQHTQPAPFTTTDLTTVEAPLMHHHDFEAGRYAAFNGDGSPFETPRMVEESFEEAQGYPADDGFQVAELPYNGDKLSMMILLPRKAEGLAELVQSLTAEKLRRCASQLEQRKFHIGLPKFKLESSYKLNTPLQRMGMKQAFDPTEANFRGLTDSRDPDHELFVSLVLHKAFVDVNEKGTEAAAATIVALEPRSAPVAQRPFIPSFQADHPFLFVIREQATGLILFIGKVEKP